jgi:hypothetical protein
MKRAHGFLAIACVFSGLSACGFYPGDTRVRLAQLRNPRVAFNVYTTGYSHEGSSLSLGLTWEDTRFSTPGCIRLDEMTVTVNGTVMKPSRGGLGGEENFYGDHLCEGFAGIPDVNSPDLTTRFVAVLEDSSARWEFQTPEWTPPGANFVLMDAPDAIHDGQRLHIRRDPDVPTHFVVASAIFLLGAPNPDAGTTHCDAPQAEDVEFSEETGVIALTVPAILCPGNGVLLLVLDQDPAESVCPRGVTCTFGTRGTRRSFPVTLVGTP